MHLNQTARYTSPLFLLLATWLFTGSGRAAEPAAGAVVITVATWGDLPDGKTLDVTKKVATLVKDNSVSIKADKATLGDPASGATNKLKVGYTVDGVYKSKTVNEGEVLDISMRLQIIKAAYGDLPKGLQADVTDVVSDMVRSNSLSVEASNELFGDPAANTPKRLKIDYSFDGVAKSVTVSEGQTAKIPVK